MSSHPSSSDSGVWSIDSAAVKTGSESKLAGKPSEKPRVQFDTVVGPECRLQGSFFFRGKSHVEGIIEGEIIAQGDLYIGEAGQVKATIRGERVFIFGRLLGDIDCTERVELFAGARVAGTISSPRLVMHDGVVFDGSCRMAEKESAAPQE